MAMRPCREGRMGPGQAWRVAETLAKVAAARRRGRMSYIEKSLGHGERLIMKARFHWWYTVQAWLALIFLGIFVIGIYIFFALMIKKWTTEIGVTTHRFIKKSGLFSIKTDEL